MTPPLGADRWGRCLTGPQLSFCFRARSCRGHELQKASILWLRALGCSGCSKHSSLTFASFCTPAVSSNQSHGEYPDCRSERETGGEASLLVSPLVVAGIVIGLVLFLSCITIIVGSLRKDSRLRNPHFRASYGQSDSHRQVSVGRRTSRPFRSRSSLKNTKIK